ncbi:hypothetical protein JCGZ_06265 [Jatropha curcas]|uniref:Uncharacterized protein n=1 Tax=Jatropha curcas TaxID=180498 RepID=A0A067KZH4_JATCU|nr:hypothetical protein JCGZ_06265 [Jatropha curcas]
MELGTWCNSGGGRYDRIVSTASFNMLESSSRSNGCLKRPRWRLLWRKIMKEKKKFLDCSSLSSTSTISRMHFSYDPCGYAQNFDQGSMWCDPDNMSRSFSARFAVPSRIFEKTELV